MNLAIPDVRTLEMHLPLFGYQPGNCRRSSGPAGNDLGVPPLLYAIRDAAGLGYNFLSIAGEQSLYHAALGELCHEAHQMRMLTTMTTRCGLLSTRRLKALVHSIDLLGIRFEAGMAHDLDPVRRSGIPFAIVFHLSASNMAELEATAVFAATHGAALLDVRPDGDLSGEVMATAWMMIECLRDIHRGELAIQLDVLNRYNLPIDSRELSSWKTGVESAERLLGELVSPLVVEDDATVVPLRHGFPRGFALGNLREAALREMAADWVRTRAGEFSELYLKVLSDAPQFADLHEALAVEAGGRGTSCSAAG